MLYEAISLSSKCGPLVENPWIGAEWLVDEPWPQHALIQRYDAEPNADGLIQLSVANGSAPYRVVGENRYAGAVLSYECELVSSAFRPAPRPVTSAS